MANGYRIPGVKPGPAFPVSAKANLLASSENQGDGDNGAGLPKQIVDEIELFTAGGIGDRSAYLVEQYAVDGGQHGLLRDGWVIDHLNPWDAKIPLQVQAGSFTLPLPVDPETFPRVLRRLFDLRDDRRHEPVQLLRPEDRRAAADRRPAQRPQRPGRGLPRSRPSKRHTEHGHRPDALGSGEPRTTLAHRFPLLRRAAHGRRGPRHVPTHRLRHRLQSMGTARERKRPDHRQRYRLRDRRGRVSPAAASPNCAGRSIAGSSRSAVTRGRTIR